MRKYWLWLAHRPGIGDRMKLRLLEHFRDPENVYFAEDWELKQVEDLSGEAVASLKDKDLSQAEQILEQCRKERLQILTFRDEAYPARLKNIADPPMVLYCRGQLPQLDERPVIAVVGTRKASSYGMRTAERMGCQIAQCGGTVVSGMAAGIDGSAMNGALRAGGTVVAVVGCGADVVYPASNRELYRKLEKTGCILSEFAPGTRPARWTFPKRNRIISGISCGVLVVEAPAKSGALITARLALDQGRDVFAVPGNIDLSSFEGSNRLLREGATPAISGWDVVSEYESLYPGKVHNVSGPSPASAPLENVSEKKQHSGSLGVLKTLSHVEKLIEERTSEKKTIDKAASSPYSDVNMTFTGLSPEGQKIISILREGDRQVDEIAAETGMTTGKLLSALTILELKGIIRRLPGKRVELKQK